MKRQAYRVSRAGSIDRLDLIEEDLGAPGENHITVAVKAIGLNFADVFTILGLYKAAPKRDCIPGIEFSGEVVDRGRNVSGLKIGDKVMGSIRFGAYVTHLNIDQRYVIPLPEGWSLDEGAAFLVQALTAYYALVPLGNIQPHQTVLIHSAVGGVGIYANRIAKRFGAYTIGTVGNSSKIPLARSEGYDEVIVRGPGFPHDLREALKGRQLDLVLDAVGGKVQRQSFDALTTTGRMVAYGLSEFASHMATPNYAMLAWRFLRMPRYHTMRLIESNKSIMGFNLIWLYDRVDALKQMLQQIRELNLEPPHIGATVPFEKLKEGVRLLQSGQTTGKVIVRVEEK
jgi:NADPH:quinone reductase-like Zn-dependent oxidoreductase